MKLDFPKKIFQKKISALCRSYVTQQGKGIQDYTHSFIHTMCKNEGLK